MSDLPLQPIIWSRSLTAQSALHEYQVRKDVDSKDKFLVKCTSRRGGKSQIKATGFATIDEAKAWAWNHYNEKMQPYVKPMPTWIDASERLPESECFYLVRLFDSHRDEHVFVILWWNAEHQQFLEWDAMCEPTHWMPIPEFSTMQNNKGD